MSQESNHLWSIVNTIQYDYVIYTAIFLVVSQLMIYIRLQV